MKLCSTAVFVGSLLVLHTATALIPGASGLSFIRRSLQDRYQIRDTNADSENVKAPNPTDVEPQRQEGNPQGLVPPEKNSLAPEEMSPDMNEIGPNDASVFDSNDPAGAGAFPKRKVDGPPYTDPEFPENTEQDPGNSLMQTRSFRKLKMYAGLTSVLAKVARLPQAVALQIDSVMGGIQKSYPADTSVGSYMTTTRFLLKNQRALLPFDLLDRIGFGRLPDLLASMPSVFYPMFRAMDRFYDLVVQRAIDMSQRVARAIRNVTERASRSLGGINFARGTDSYSLNVPNLLDMVFKGRLANYLDELFAYLQRGIGSSLSSIGSMFGGASNPTNDPVSEMNNNPVPEDEPIRNQPAYRMRSNPRYSAMRNMYNRPSRYFNN